MNGFLEHHLTRRVYLSPVYSNPMGGRMGTVEIAPRDFYRKFRDPHQIQTRNVLNHSKFLSYADQKVTVEWCFTTPRGVAIVRDYWWNGEKEMSIQAGNARAARWVKYFLKSRGINAY